MTNTTELKKYSIESFKIKYMAEKPLQTKKELLTNPERVISTFRSLVSEFDGGISVEHFGVFFLNTQNELIGFKMFNTGTVDQVAVYPRMIVHTSLMIGASGMILAHNHPSGYSDPSENDKQLTRLMKEAGRLFDIRVLDHIIVSANSYFSFLEKGIL
jgi:DNA repair protein RadC